MKNLLQHVQAFLAVARQGSFARAAEELHLSPPALTVQIQQLEAWLEVQLLERTPRRVQLTTAGEELRGPLERILVDLGDVQTHARDLAGLRRGRITLAALPSFFMGPFPELLKTFQARHPAIEVRLQDVVAGRVEALVREGQVDLGIGVRPRAVGLDFQPLYVDHLQLFVPRNHPWTGRTEITLAELDAVPLLLTGRDSSVRECLDFAFAAAGLRLVAALEANYMSTLLALVAAEQGLALLPESAGGEAPVVALPVRGESLARPLGILTPTGRSLTPAAQAFVDLLRERLQVL